MLLQASLFLPFPNLSREYTFTSSIAATIVSSISATILSYITNNRVDPFCKRINADVTALVAKSGIVACSIGCNPG